MRTYYPNAATRSPVAPSPAVTESMECEADSEEETPLRPAALAPKQQHPLAILSHTPVPTRSRPGRALATLQEEQGEGRHGVEGEGEAAEQQQQGQEQDQGQAQAQAQAQEQDGELETVAAEASTCRATTPLQDAQRARTTNSGLAALADLAVTAPPPAPSTTLPTLPTLSTPVAPFTPEPVAVAAPKAKGEGAQAAGAARPFICAVPGCEKDYMDQQGLDQHPELPLQRPAPGEAGAPIGVGSRVVDSAGTLGEIIARNAAWLTMRTDAGEERNVRKADLELLVLEAEAMPEAEAAYSLRQRGTQHHVKVGMAVEAAVEDAPAPPEHISRSDGLVTEVDGLQLHLSATSSTGYRGVVDYSQSGKERDRPFKAQATAPRVRTLGHFATKVEAAVCYAKWVEEQERCEQP